VPLAEDEVPQRTCELVALFDRAGAKGPGRLWARLARKRADGWAARVVEHVRARRLSPRAESAARVIAAQTDEAGKLLVARAAGVELLNVLRPCVAFGRLPAVPKSRVRLRNVRRVPAPAFA